MFFVMLYRHNVPVQQLARAYRTPEASMRASANLLQPIVGRGQRRPTLFYEAAPARNAIQLFRKRAMNSI